VEALEVKKAAYVDFWKKMSIIQVLGITLHVADKPLGCLILLLDPLGSGTIRIDFFKTVSAQISVAVSNILANEDIVRREEEKTTLLLLSNEIAALRNRNDLFQVVNTKLKQLFSISEFGIAYIDPDNKTYRAFVLDLEEPITNHTAYKKVTSDPYNVTDPVFSKVMNAAEPVLFRVHELSAEADVPAYVHFWKDVGVQHVWGWHSE
jgi:hypothetical protein